MTVRVRTPRRRQRGLTLLELVVGVFIAVFLTAAAVAFAAHETRLMGISRDRLDIAQASRASLDLLVSDLAMAGGGVGYFENGNFAGLDTGPFTIGGCNFNANGAANNFNPGSPPPAGAFTSIPLTAVGQQGTVGTAYNLPTVDIGIRMADGSYATIADYNAAGAGQYCFDANDRFNSGGLAVMRTGDFLAARTVRITTTNNPVGCSFHTCVNQCVSFVFNPVAAFQSSPGVGNITYLGGELQGGYKRVVWFVASDGNVGTLRRAVFDTFPEVCGTRDNNLGGAVADLVETMQVQVYQYVTDTAVFGGAPAWVNVGQVPINNRFRTRVDLELVMRTRAPLNNQRTPELLRLRANTCVPSVGACNALQDYGDRRVYRTSVEVKNASI